MESRTLGVLLVVGVLAACQTGPGRDGEDGEAAAQPLGGADEVVVPAPEFRGEGPEDPPEIYPEDPSARVRRRELLEQAGDRWNEARLQQRYAEQASLEAGMRTYARDHFDALLSDVRAGPPRNKRIAAWALGFSGSREAVPVLFDALDSPFTDVVLHSLLSLATLAQPGRGGSPSQVMTPEDAPEGERYEPDEIELDPRDFLSLLQHENGRVRSNAALVILHSLDAEDGTTASRETVLALIAAKSDSDAATRVHVMGALGRTNSRLAVPHLVRALEDDPVPLVRIRAALGLARLDATSAVPNLIDALARPNQDDQVAKYVAGALSHILDEPNLRSRRAEDWIPIAKSQGLL